MDRDLASDFLHWILDGEPLTTPEERAAHGGRWRTCRECGGEFQQAQGARKVAYYCSRRCQAYAMNHRARCRECGARCRSLRCQPCADRLSGLARRKWSDDDVIAAIAAWIAEHGKPPTCSEWLDAGMRPAVRIAQIRFGTWTNAVDLALERIYRDAHRGEAATGEAGQLLTASGESSAGSTPALSAP